MMALTSAEYVCERRFMVWVSIASPPSLSKMSYVRWSGVKRGATDSGAMEMCSLE